MLRVHPRDARDVPAGRITKLISRPLNSPSLDRKIQPLPLLTRGPSGERCSLLLPSSSITSRRAPRFVIIFEFPRLSFALPPRDYSPSTRERERGNDIIISISSNEENSANRSSRHQTFSTFLRPSLSTFRIHRIG